ncbi:MAG: hypothetical protein Q8O67_23075 [Deltaproteobacteria bacterium]|nr:hypothetical protein [Deltaproteobacteria bacterium]
MRSFFAAAVIVPVGLCAGCDLLDNPPELPPPPPVDVPDVDDLIAEVEDAILEKLECEEILRPSTLGRIRDVIKNADASTVQALLLNPQDLASVVALGGVQVEAPVVVARNLFRIVETGVAADLLNGGWDGVLCGDAVPLLCTAGAEASTVTCDVDGKATAINLAFDGCTLGGTVYEGAVTFTRVADDDTVAGLTFAEFTLDEIRRLDGDLVLDVGAGTQGFAAAIGAPDVFELFDHGGLASGLECAAETTFEAVGLDVDDDSAQVEMIAFRSDPDATIGIETFGDHLSFGDPTACGCPLPGSGAFVDVPRPLGRAGESGRAKISWKPPFDGGSCASVQVELETWPTDCAGLDDVDGDCARAATEVTLGKLLGALCGVN